MTDVKFLGTHSIRSLKENEVYFCQEGCGDCKKVTVDEDNRTVTTNVGALLERQYSKVELSSCCKAEIGIWDISSDEEVPVEYLFTPSDEDKNN